MHAQRGLALQGSSQGESATTRSPPLPLIPRLALGVALLLPPSEYDLFVWMGKPAYPELFLQSPNSIDDSCLPFSEQSML